MFRILAFLTCILGVCSTSMGQATSLGQAKTSTAHFLNEDDIADVFSIADMSFVIRESTIAKSSLQERNLSKLLSPAEAVKRGLPSKATGLLIERLLHGRHEPELTMASAVNDDQAGFYWQIKWELFASPGGSSGIPYQYRAIVRSDGSVVKPELFLCDDYGSFSQRDADEVVFSVLALDDLLPIAKSKVNPEKIVSAAKRSFELAKQQFKLKPNFQSLPPKRVVFPGSLATKATNEQLEVWLVRFVDKKIENPENTKYVGSIAVWVTSDLVTSELTMGEWSATSKRKVVTKNSR